MKVAVCGLWHLGCVTAACLADAGFTTLGYDPDKHLIKQLQTGHAPLHEPMLDETLQANLDLNLKFTSLAQELVAAEIIWITFDTPVDDDDHADVDAVKNEIYKLFRYISSDACILISSQLPVGTTRELINYAKTHYPDKPFHFAYSPENLRLGKALEVFRHPDRVIMGIETQTKQILLQNLFRPFTEQLLWMSIESAEMSKHALNAFLATSVVFINEIAALCEQVGADAREVEQSLKSEARIGQKAYLRPGGAIAGGTLARDVNYLVSSAQKHGIAVPFLSALLTSNQAHKTWAAKRLSMLHHQLAGKTITVLGLTYKSGTSALRRSSAIEMCQYLSQQGAKVQAYDPLVSELPIEFANFIQLHKSIPAALKDSDATLINSDCSEFKALSADEILSEVNNAFILDANGYLEKTLGTDNRIKYLTVGRPHEIIQ